MYINKTHFLDFGSSENNYFFKSIAAYDFGKKKNKYKSVMQKRKKRN